MNELLQQNIGKSLMAKDQAYTMENSNPDDKEIIQDCMYVFEPGLVYLHEIPFSTKFVMSSVFVNKNYAVLKKKEKAIEFARKQI